MYRRYVGGAAEEAGVASLVYDASEECAEDVARSLRIAATDNASKVDEIQVLADRIMGQSPRQWTGLVACAPT